MNAGGLLATITLWSQDRNTFFLFFSCYFFPPTPGPQDWSTADRFAHTYTHTHTLTRTNTHRLSHLCVLERGFRAIKPVLHKINRADQRRGDPPLPQTEGRTSERWPKGRHFRHHKPKCLWKSSDLNTKEACFSVVFRKKKEKMTPKFKHKGKPRKTCMLFPYLGLSRYPDQERQKQPWRKCKS